LVPLSSSLDANPFGQRLETGSAARAVAQHCEAMIADSARQPLTAAAVAKIASALCQRGIASPMNFEEARQLAWILRIALDELPWNKKEKLQVAAIFNRLEEPLHLDIARRADDTSISSSTRLRAPQWGVPASYDPDEFRRCLAEIQGLIQPVVQKQ
jgi:hypothetical protein